MKTIFHLLLVFTIFSAIKLTGQGIIIDHNCTELEQIPLSVITDIQENIKWHYAHISHGQQLINGMDIIEGNNSVYGITWGLFLPNIPNELCVYNGNCGYPT